jgi:hypothetical protein
MKRLAFLLPALAVACAGSASDTAGSSWQNGARGDADASSGTAGERWFPLKDGTLYHYKTEVLGDNVSTGMLVAKVHRPSGSRGELRKPAGTQVFDFVPGGIATQTKTGAPAFLLKLPLDPNTQWLGPHGGVTKLSQQNLTVTLDFGTFNGCISTEELRGGDSPLRIVTTLCPEVGITSLEVSQGGGVERARLVYFGPPIDIGGEGLQRVE